MIRHVRTLALGAALVSAGGVFADVVRITNGGETNATRKVAAALARAKDGDTIVFEKGEYHFYEEGTVRRQIELINGMASCGEKNVLFSLDGRANVTVDGGGSRFVWHGNVFPFAVTRSSGVTLKNFTAQANRPAYAEFTFVARHEDGYTLRFKNPDAVRVGEGGRLLFETDLGQFDSGEKIISVHALERCEIAYLFAGNEKSNRKDLPAMFMNAVAEPAADGCVRIRNRHQDLPGCADAYYHRIGEPAALLLNLRERCTLYFDHCRDARVENVRIESGDGMGLVCYRTENLTVDGLAVAPVAGSRISTTADGIMIINNRGKVEIVNSEICWTMDDAINIHGNYLRVVSADGKRVSVETINAEQWRFHPYHVGDRLEFSDPKTHDVLLSASVVSVVSTARGADLVLDRDASSCPRGTLVEDCTWIPDVRIANCFFHDTMNLRLSGRGKWLFEDNRLSNGVSLLIDDLGAYWGEAGRTADMTIRRNFFDAFSGRVDGRPVIVAEVEGRGETCPKIHRGLRIVGNRYRGVKGDFVRLPCAADPVVEGNWCDEASSGYSSLLRVGENVLYDAQAESNLWHEIAAHPTAFSEMTVFSQFNHSVRPLSHHARTAEKIAPFLRRAEALGLKAGINVLATIGFFEDEYSDETADLPMAIDINDYRQRGRLCPLSPKTLDYVRRQYEIFANCRPAFMYVDDDVMMTPCYCDACMARFAELHPEFNLPAAATRADFARVINSTNLALRTACREAWIAFGDERYDRLYEVIERCVHAIDPKIGLGVMACSTGHCGMDQARWAKTLRGPTDCELRWRPGGGVWNDYSMPDLVNKAYRMAGQTRFLPAHVAKIQAEIENFPYQSLRKSSSFMAFEMLYDLGVGCTGSAWNFCGFNATDAAETAPYFEVVTAVGEAGAEVSRAFGRSPCRGVAYPWDGFSAAQPTEPDFARCRDVPQPYDLAAIGLPVSTEPTNASVTLLDAACALRLSDEALARVLAGGVLMDAEALDVVNGRGFGALTGFKTAGAAPRDAITRDRAHPLNVDGRYLRDLRTAFGWHQPITKIEKTADAAEYTEEASSLLGVACGFAGGVFENAKGGRIAVETMLPFTFCEGHARCVHLKRLFRWLSHERLPSYLTSFHRATVFDRGGKWLVANLATEPMVGGELALLGGAKLRVTVLAGGRVISRSTIQPSASDGPYGRYRLPDLPYLGMALLVPCE